MSVVHTVQQGEYLAKIAKQHRVRNWRTIYDHPANELFRQLRPNPNVIYPGDRIVIPDVETKFEECHTGQRHEFRLVRQSRVMLRILLRNDRDEPYAFRKCAIEVNDIRYLVTSGHDGLIEQAISTESRTARVTLLDQCISWSVQIGDLDPALDGDQPVIAGALARLNNLGFRSGTVTPSDVSSAAQAIAAFQKTYMGQEIPTGKLCRATCKALEERHGC